MPRPAILAVDQGTTNTKASVIAVDDGAILARDSRPLDIAHPRPGWAEQSADALYLSVIESGEAALRTAADATVAALAIANQRETIILWDAATGEPLAPAISWQCRRTADRCAALMPHAAAIAASTGLGLDPLAPSTKLAWLLDTLPDARARAEAGELRAGTVDSWLVWKLTGGAVHATDVSNASRTQLMALATLDWDPALLDLFGIPGVLLPEIRLSDAGFGAVAAGTALDGLPIAAVLGDSHAALLGHGFAAAGEVKVTCGTGSSLMALTPDLIRSANGLWTTIGWGAAGSVHYALEGNVAVSGQAAAFAARLLGLSDAAALTDLARSVESAEGVVFVPALAGIGAPRWDTAARGALTGMSLGTRPAHVARAVLEGIAMQIADIVWAIDADLGTPVERLAVDGGAAMNDLLMQTLADTICRPVLRPANLELGARGVARLAAAAVQGEGEWPPLAYDRFSPASATSDARSRWELALRSVQTNRDGL